MELSQLLLLLRRWWYVIVAFALLGGLVGAGWAAMQPRVYQASATGTVSPSTPSEDPGNAAVYQSLSVSKVRSYVQWAESRNVAEYVIEALNLSTSPEALVRQIGVSNPQDTPVINISARAESPEQARDIATAWIEGLALEGARLDGGSLDGTEGEPPVLILQVTEHAAIPSSPISPNLRMTLLISMIAGGVIGFGLALVMTVLDRRVRSVQQLEEAFELPVLGTLPFVKRMASEGRLAEASQSLTNNSTGSYSPSAEAFRELRTNLQYVHVDDPPRTMVVSSAIPGEGKSTVTANLAISLAASGQPVVVVDGDLRKPTVAQSFDLVEGAGLTDVLSGRATIDDVVQTWNDTPNLLVITAGRIPPNPSELLGTNAMRALLKELSQSAIVLIDAPPLVPVTDASILARVADGILVVTSANSTRIDLVEKALANLERVKIKPLGLILNRLRRKDSQSGYYGYETYYASNSASGKKKPPARRQSKHGVQRRGPKRQLASVSGGED